MVFNLIDFLLGGKKGAQKPSKAATGQQPQNPAPVQPVQGAQQPQQPAQQPAQGAPAQPAADGQAGAATPQEATPQQGLPQTGAPGDDPNAGNRVRVADVLTQLQEETKATGERVTTLIGDMKNMENSLNSLGHRIDDLDQARKSTDEKLSEIDGNMTKFLSLYELINNQYNPFVEKSGINPAQAEPQPIVLDSEGNAAPQDLGYSDVKEGFEHTGQDPQTIDLEAVGNSNPLPQASPQMPQQRADVDSAILELDTLNIHEAASDAVPLTSLKTNTNSLVTILSWLEYLIKRVGIDETRNTLRYYTEVLRWITPEVFFDLDKYLKGMNDKKDVIGGERLSVKDHIVSLYFISKLNEKTLDDKLTKAVLQIIKQ